MASYQSFELEELQADRSRSYAEFLRRPGLSMGIYHLPTGGTDAQHPHSSPIMGLTLMFSVLTLLGQLLADVLYAFVDPRVTYT